MNESDFDEHAKLGVGEISEGATEQGEVVYHPARIMTGEFIGVEEEGDGASEGGEGMSGDEIEGVKAARTAARKLREFVRIGNMTAVGCMSSVSQEWSIIAFPFLWKVSRFPLLPAASRIVLTDVSRSGRRLHQPGQQGRSMVYRPCHSSTCQFHHRNTFPNLA